jgi:hypothetical protein
MLDPRAVEEGEPQVAQGRELECDRMAAPTHSIPRRELQLRPDRRRLVGSARIARTV